LPEGVENCELKGYITVVLVLKGVRDVFGGGLPMLCVVVKAQRGSRPALLG
jgi:hypothetical protein